MLFKAANKVHVRTLGVVLLLYYILSLLTYSYSDTVIKTCRTNLWLVSCREICPFLATIVLNDHCHIDAIVTPETWIISADFSFQFPEEQMKCFLRTCPRLTSNDSMKQPF